MNKRIDVTTRKYGGVPISHDAEDVGLIQRTVEEFKPDFSVELGTLRGGLTLAIHDAYRPAPIATFDNQRVYAVEMATLIALRFVVFSCVDILSREHPEVLRYVGNSLKKKFLYCDNGNKVKELWMYGRHLSSGDMLGVHDWGTEIHTDRSRVDARWKAINDRKDFERLTILLKDFELVGEGRLTRLWIRR